MWISIGKFDALWRRTDEYIADADGADDNPPQKYARVGELLGAGKPTWMPTSTDGRHRDIWMREHGAWSLPMAVSASEAQAVRALCGTRYRTSWFERPRSCVRMPAILAVFGPAAMGALAATQL